MSIHRTLIVLLLAATAAVASEPNRRLTTTVRVFRDVRDSVVNINTTQTVRQRFGPFGNDPFFGHFFGGGRIVERERTSLGSGFIIHAAGYIVTNAHVVQSADAVEVKLGDGTILPAKVLAADTDHDLAILRVNVPDGKTLSPVTLGDSSDLMPGEPVIAIGNPLGYEHSVTSGIVSAVDRPLRVRRGHELQNLIQTDTPINPGNSGGPLLNAYGQVVGINSAIRGDAQNIGFAIPVNDLRELIGELLSPLALNRADLGGKVTEHRALTPPADVRTILRWRPADEGKPPRPITAINGKAVGNIVEAYVALLEVSAGDTVKLGGPDGEFTLTAKAPDLTNAQRLARSLLGLTPREPTSVDRARLKLGAAKGLLIEALVRQGPAHRGGLEPGDLIVQLGHHRIADLDDLAVLLSGAKPGDQADVYVLRQGRLGRVRLSLGPAGSQI